MSIRTRSLASLAVRSILAVALLVGTGCVGGAWNQALEEDTPAAYHRFMREHADSQFAGEARERLDYHKLLRRPSIAGFETFQKKYPDSEFIEKLYPVLEKPAFEAARVRGTALAYRDFVASFPPGEYPVRAEGNAVFLEAAGFGGDPTRLAAFAARYPTSDYTAEATRTVEAVAARRSGRIDRVGLVLKIASNTPEWKRVREALVKRVTELTERVGIKLVPVPDRLDPADADRYPRVRLEVSHAEKPVDYQVKTGQLARPAVLGVTRVVLRDADGGEVIADRRFEIRVEDKAHVPGTSVLFSRAARRYWDEFFVPIARWRNNRAIRPPIALNRPIVDLDGLGDRAVVLFEDGDFELIGLSDPTEPVTLARYSRSEDYKKWTGVRILGDRVAIYGEEGLELIRFTASGPVAEKTWNRSEIGRVFALAPLGKSLVLAGAKGLQILDLEKGTLRRVMRRVLKSVATSGELLVFVDGESVYLSTLALLAEGRVIAQMKLGKTFGPNNVRVIDHAAIITGPGGALVIDLRNPAQPKAVAKLSSREIGQVFDATQIRGRTFLVGERGLQVLTRKLDRVEETIDVGERNRVSVMGRHLVAADGHGIQVVDATPWADGQRPAAASPKRPGSLLNGSGF